MKVGHYKKKDSKGQASKKTSSGGGITPLSLQLANSHIVSKSQIVQQMADNSSQVQQSLELQSLANQYPSHVAPIQMVRHGYVPPTTFGRFAFLEPSKGKEDAKGQRSVVPRKYLTRSERMIDRIGRILATETNVHVAVALDDNALVISANVENPDQKMKLVELAPRLKNIMKGEDPLENSGEKRVTGNRRVKDLKKVNLLLQGAYTEDDGIEMNPYVSDQLERIRTALDVGIIPYETYHSGAPGIFIVTTPKSKSDPYTNMHGELKVTETIKSRRAIANYFEKDVYVGGTLADCLACNASHKISNDTSDQDWKFYTGGTHGGMFVGYRPSKTAVKGHAKFKELTGEEIEDRNKEISKVNADLPSKNSLPDDSDSEAEDLPRLQHLGTLNRRYLRITRKIQKVKNKIARSAHIIENLGETIKLIQNSLEQMKKRAPELHFALDQLTRGCHEGYVKLEQLKKETLDKKGKADVAKEELGTLKDRIKKDPAILGKQRKDKDNPYPHAIPLEFYPDGTIGKQGHEKTGYIGEGTIKDVVKKYSSYKNTFEAAKDASSEYMAAQKRENDVAEDLVKTEKEMAAIQSELDQLTRLPADILARLEEIEYHKKKNEARNLQLGRLAIDSGVARDDLKKEALQTDDTAVKKLDWLNQENIEAYRK